MEETSESGSGHSNRLRGLRRFYGLVMWSVVVRGQNRDFSWQEAMAFGDGSERRELTVSFVSSCLVSRVSFRLVFSEAKRKRGAEG